MPFFTGQTGTILYGATAGGTASQTIAKVRSWNLDVNLNTAETTSLGDFAATNVGTIKSATGSAEIFYYTLEGETNTVPVSTVLTKLIKQGASTQGDRCVLELRIDSSKKFVINAWITSAQVGQSTGEVTRATINFTMDGDFLTGTTA